MANTPRISKAKKLTLAVAGSAALLALAATSTAVASPQATPAAETTNVTPTITATPTPTESPTSTASAPTMKVTSRQATEIAAKRLPGARVSEVEREQEHGHLVWKVGLVKSGFRYEVYVSTATGDVVKFGQGRDHSVRGVGDDHGGLDDRGRDDHGRDDHGRDDRGVRDDHGGHGGLDDRGGRDDHGGKDDRGGHD